MSHPQPPPPETSSRRPRLSGRFEEPEESSYHEQKFQELKAYSWRVMVTLPPLLLGLWAWDWAIDPRAAPSTWPLRLGMAACLAPCILYLKAPGVTLRRYTLLLYASVIATQFFWLAILLRLQDGMVHGVAGYMYYVLGMLVVGLPLRFRDNVLGLSLSLLIPDLAAAAGWLPGFSPARYNTLIFPAAGLSLFTLWAFDRLYRRLFRSQQDAERLAGEDALTGLPNRRQFMRALEQAFEQARRYGRPLSLLMLDLDHFKSINDRYGHAAGDAVLQAVARVLQEHQRASDLAARLGGEEFGMLLPETELDGAIATAERLRAACEALRITVPGGVWAPISLTLSVGAATRGLDDHTTDDFLRRADAALYRAKHGGRNRVEQ